MTLAAGQVPVKDTNRVHSSSFKVLESEVSHDSLHLSHAKSAHVLTDNSAVISAAS